MRAGYGERRKQALSAIKAWERKRVLWGAKDVAEALGISTQQAWSLIQSLTYSGALTRGERTVVVEDALRLSEGA